MKKITKKIKFFFDVLVKSITKFTFYKEINKAKFKFSLKYLFFLFYLLSLIGSIIFAGSLAVLVLPKVPSFISEFQNKANSLYPNDLIVTVKSGIVSTNQKNPYYLDSLNQFNLSKGYDHFLTIDTSDVASPGDIQKDKTAILITKDSVVTAESSQSSYKVYPINKDTNYQITKSSYSKLISQISPYLKYIKPGLIVLIILVIILWPFLAAALSLGTELIYLLIFTCLLFLLAKLMKKALTYKKLYQLAIHAATLPIILSFVVSSLGIQMPFLLGSAILFIFMIIVLNQF